MKTGGLINCNGLNMAEIGGIQYIKHCILKIWVQQTRRQTDYITTQDSMAKY